MTVSKPASLIDDRDEVREITLEDAHLFKRIGRPPLPEHKRKQRVTLMLDPDVLALLKADGKGWQTRANALLRSSLGV